jgi:multidrug resistance efflux pump
MSSNMMRLGLLVGLATLLAGALAWSQDRPAALPGGASHIDVFNPVEGRLVVLTSRPEGTRVEKGDIVCELDATELKDRLAPQELAVRGADADVQGARIAREVAVLALNEYKEGTFHQEYAAVEGEIKLVEAQLSRAEDKVEWARRMFNKGYASKGEKVSDELRLKQARFALERAQIKKKVLLDYSKDKTIKALMGAVETARGRELARQATAERERSLQKRLTDQISRCKIAAPDGGRIIYAAPMGAGAVVHDRQLLFRVEP